MQERYRGYIDERVSPSVKRAGEETEIVKSDNTLSS